MGYVRLTLDHLELSRARVGLHMEPRLAHVGPSGAILRCCWAAHGLF